MCVFKNKFDSNAKLCVIFLKACCHVNYLIMHNYFHENFKDVIFRNFHEVNFSIFNSTQRL
jgi:hypothetical protein